MKDAPGVGNFERVGALALAASFWLWSAPVDVYAETVQRNAWPFAGFNDTEIADYVDEQATMLTINRLSGRALITLEDNSGRTSRIEVAFGKCQLGHRIGTENLQSIIVNRHSA